MCDHCNVIDNVFEDTCGLSIRYSARILSSFLRITIIVLRLIIRLLLGLHNALTICICLMYITTDRAECEYTYELEARSFPIEGNKATFRSHFNPIDSIGRALQTQSFAETAPCAKKTVTAPSRAICSH